RDQQNGAARHAALRQRHRQGVIATLLEPGDLALEALSEHLAIEPEIVGIGAHEAERVNRARQAGILIFFDGPEEGGADAQRGTDVLDPGAMPLARLAQLLADRPRAALAALEPLLGVTVRGLLAVVFPSRKQCHG